MFKMHQESEKENAHLISIKESTNIVENVGNKVLTATLAAGAAAFNQQQQRTNFMLLTNINNANNNAKTNKQPFSDIGVKLKDGNANDANKPCVLPVVEEFRSFKVYEDEIQETETIKITVTKNELNTHQKPFTCLEHHDLMEILDNTPVATIEVFSPMSVDPNNSSFLISEENFGQITKLIDKTVEKETAKALEEFKKFAPRNDRERFFDVVEYQQDILQYFRESERKHRPKPHYMRRQNDINHSMRTILVDWLVEVSEEYNLDTETLYLSILFIDRFLSHMSVMRNKLQLVGTTAMYIASKYEEIYPPEINDYVFITDDTFNKSQILRMEQIMLKILTFDLCTPTIYVFANMFASITNMPEKLKQLTLFISELSLLEADPYIRFLPSLISASAMALARITLGYSIWTSQLEKMTSYRLEDTKEVFLYLSKSHNAASNYKLQAIQDKYKNDKHLNVAAIEPLQQIDEDKFVILVEEYNLLLTRSIEGQKVKNTPTKTKDNLRHEKSD